MKGTAKGIIRALLFLPLVAHAQWMTQTIELEQGWNAVYLTVQPLPAACDSVFSNAPVERVMMWERTKGGQEYISDVDEELPRPSDWLVWRPASDPQAALNSLRSLRAGKAYLVKMSESETLSVKGRAVLLHPEWLPNEMTLTGLPVTDGVITFSDAFSHTDEIGINFTSDGGIYKVGTGGGELQVYRPSWEYIRTGSAYWIKTGQILDYDGSLEVTLADGGDWMDFGSEITAKTLELKNIATETRTVTIETLEGEAGDPAQEGTVPLAYIRMNPETLLTEYVPMPEILSTNIAPNATVKIVLMPRVNEMISENPNAVWGSILRICDGEVEQLTSVRCRQEEEEFTDPTGLWVGTVAVDAVSRATNAWDTATLLPVSRTFAFRILVHVSSDGTGRLLQCAMPAWLPAEEEEDEAETYIFTDAVTAAQFEEDHDEAQVARISSANFPLMDPEPMAGTFGSTSINGLACTVTLPFDDPVNPFVHPFHPDHDNKEYLNGNASDLGEGEESFTVTRQINLAFAESDPLGTNPNWTVSEHGGVYTETVSGLNKTIFTQGAFRLEKVSSCGVLDGLEP